MRLEHSNLARLVPGTEETSLEVNWLDDEVKYMSLHHSPDSCQCKLER